MPRPVMVLDDALEEARAPRRPIRCDNITGQTYLEHGQPVTVLARWSGNGPRSVLIQRADGSKVVRPFRGLRRPDRR